MKQLKEILYVEILTIEILGYFFLNNCVPQEYLGY